MQNSLEISNIPGICDAPYWTVDNLLQQIAQRHKDIDYVIVTGDFESHAIWDYTRDAHQRMIRNVSQLIKNHFPDKQIYFALGNHEGKKLSLQKELESTFVKRRKYTRYRSHERNFRYG